MATQRDTNKSRLAVSNFAGGRVEFENLVGENQFSDSSNMEYFNGELRTRGGQRWIATTSDRLEGHFTPDLTTGGTATLTMVTPGATDTFYFHSGLSLVAAGIKSWKCAAFIFAQTVMADTALTASVAYYDGADWVDIPHREYDLTGAYPAALTAGALSKASWMLVVGETAAENNAESDTFFEDWTVHSGGGAFDPGFWLRYTIDSGTTSTTNADLSLVAGIPSLRPQAITSMDVSGGGRAMIVARPELTMEGGDFTQIRAIQNAVQVAVNGNPADLQEPLIEHATTGSSAAPYNDHPTTGFVIASQEATDGSTGTRNRLRGRLFTPNETFALMPQTGRIVLTANSGLVSIGTAVGEDQEFNDSDQVAKRRLTFSKYPIRGDKFSVAFDDILTMSSLPAPVTIGAFENRFVFGFADGTVRWSFATPYEQVVPPEAFEQIESDEPRFTAMKQFNGFLICFTENSIWAMERDGTNTLSPSGVLNYRLRKVVSGLGAVNQASVVEVNGALWFLHESGMYVFNGQGEPQKVTSAIQKTFDSGLNRPGLRHACAAYYKSKRQVWFSVARTGSWYNNLVIVFDLNTGGIFFFDDINAEQMLYESESSKLYTVDLIGRVWQQGYGAADGLGAELGINCHVESGPIVGADFNSVRLTDALLYLRHYVGSTYTITPKVNGVEGAAESFDLDKSETAIPAENATEVTWGDSNFTLDAGSLLDHERRKKVFALEAADGDTATVKIASSSPAAGDRLSILGIELRAQIFGIR